MAGINPYLMDTINDVYRTRFISLWFFFNLTKFITVFLTLSCLSVHAVEDVPTNRALLESDANGTAIAVGIVLGVAILAAALLAIVIIRFVTT